MARLITAPRAARLRTTAALALNPDLRATMYAVDLAELTPATGQPADDVETVITTLLEMRDRAISGRDFLYTPLLSQHLIEKEIPRLVALIQTAQGTR